MKRINKLKLFIYDVLNAISSWIIIVFVFLPFLLVIMWIVRILDVIDEIKRRRKK